MYFRRYDLGGEDSVDATAFAYAEKKKPIINADRIRSMTDEELAELFLAHDEQLYRHCPSDKRAEDCYADFGKAFDACEKCWLGWLKAPVEEVQDG